MTIHDPSSTTTGNHYSLPATAGNHAVTGNHYTVLARRFRPQAFDDVVGQEHVARALRNAIRAGRVAHAYMFTGARGVGKTSTARILAKALNCPNAVDGVPCNQCDICDGISAGNDVDVLEIDGASNRGIDDIRSLRANVGVRSMRTQFKVYIIDEVHMLTKEAFNALLKTLEEPPPNVKFVFCTTEPNKVPDTILSRCQRFDFSSINDRSIGDRLREIAKIEGFEVTEDALELVARRARGSMRDSQSLFDQLLAFSDGTVSSDDVHRMLGTAGDERLVELFDAILEHRPGEVLAQLDASFGLGVQPGELMDQAIGYVRDLIVAISGGTEVPLCSVANRHRPILVAQASRLGIHSVMAAFQILSDGKNQMFRSTFARTILEMAMVQLSLLENLTAISDLLSGRLPVLPEMRPPAATTSAATVGTSVTVPTTSASGEKKNFEAIISSPVKSALPPDMMPELDEDDDARDEIGNDIDSETESSQVMVATTQVQALSYSEHSVESSEAPRPVEQPTDPTPHVRTAQPAVADRSEAVSNLTQADCPALFQNLLKGVGLTIQAGLKMASDMVLVAPNRIELHLDAQYDFARKVLDQPDNRAKIEAEIQRLTGSMIGVNLRLIVSLRPTSVPVAADPTQSLVPSTSPNNAGNRRAQKPASKSNGAAATTIPESVPLRNLLGEVDPTRDPFVRQVMDVFGATVVKVTVAPAVKIDDHEAS